mgnify:CR=1 FL=1
MNWVQLRPDFYYAENIWDTQQARDYLSAILRDGEDPLRGFHHPNLKANRFHANPKYPVKRYMGYGHYWNPLDYLYHELQPNGARPWEIPQWMHEISRSILSDLFPQHLPSWQAQSALVNYYTSNSKMGLHVDKEEADHRAPVIGISFGGTCRFLFENDHGEEQSLLLPGNSLYCFGERARLMRHGVGTTYTNTLSPESSGLLGDKERLSVTLRKIFL